MRYAGQGWEIPVPLPDRAFAQATPSCRFASCSETNYARFFGRAIDGLDGLEIEIVTWSVKASDERPPLSTAHRSSHGDTRPSGRP